MTSLSPTTGWRLWLAALSGALLTGACAMGVAHACQLGPVDDAYISLRYAANWANGIGLCFNPGETVEGYTNFLLVALWAAAIRGGVDPLLAMTVSGWFGLMLLAALVVVFSARHLFPGRVIPSIASGVLITLHPVLLCWATSGLEGCLYAALLLASVLSILESGSVRSGVLAGVLLTLAGLARPEALALFPVWGVLLYRQHRSARSVFMFAATFTCAYGAYFVIRLLHFGHLFPNTFYAKLDFGSGPLLDRGLGYVFDFSRASVLLLVAAGVSVVLIRRAPRWVAAFAVIVAAQLAVVVYEGGDHFPLFRFMVPVLPFLAALALYPAAVIARRIVSRQKSTAFLVGFVLVMVGATDLLSASRIRPDKKPLQSQFQWYRYETSLTREWVRIGHWMHHHLPAESSLSTMSIGAVGYHSGLTIIDPLGIVDPVIAHRRSPLGDGYAGHEKYDPDYILSREPDYVMLLDVATRAPVPEVELDRAIWGASNRALLRDARFARRYRYEHIAVGPVYLNLHVRRDLPPLSEP
ncbi:MAG: hypothetical protein GY842_01990 [bacterium]|nr:hypothetical protein [bacterium]